jgi:hypothetical protein
MLGEGPDEELGSGFAECVEVFWKLLSGFIDPPSLPRP